MDLGLIVPHIGFNSSPEALVAVAQAAEELDFTALWTADHVIIPSTYESQYPFSDDDKIGLGGEQPYYEMFTTLSFLAAVTTKARLGTATAIVPYRHPVLTAKIVSTIDQLSKGRMLLGVGVGWLEEEFDALDADFGTRGKATDDALALMRAAWAPDQPVTYEGSHFAVRDAWFEPRPFQDRTVPVWVGGSTDAALRRTARVGDGWMPHLYGADPEWLRSSMARIAELQDLAGTDKPIDLGLFVPIAFSDTDPDPDDEPVWKRKAVIGTPDYVASVLRTYADAGVNHVALMFSGGIDQRIQTLETLNREVMPAL